MSECRGIAAYAELAPIGFTFTPMSEESRLTLMSAVPTVAKNRGLAPQKLREIERMVFDHQDFLKGKYDEYHSS